MKRLITIVSILLLLASFSSCKTIDDCPAYSNVENASVLNS